MDEGRFGWFHPLPVACSPRHHIKWSAGRSVVAAAAYRAAAKIEDVTTGLVHNYTRKKGIDHTEILSPISASLGNEWLADRQELWNQVEQIERRKDAE